MSTQPQPVVKPYEHQEFPRVMYHPEQAPQIVQSEEHKSTLGEGWVDHPSKLPDDAKQKQPDAPKVAKSAQQQLEELAMQLADQQAQLDRDKAKLEQDRNNFESEKTQFYATRSTDETRLKAGLKAAK